MPRRKVKAEPAQLALTPRAQIQRVRTGSIPFQTPAVASSGPALIGLANQLANFSPKLLQLQETFDLEQKQVERDQELAGMLEGLTQESFDLNAISMRKAVESGEIAPGANPHLLAGRELADLNVSLSVDLRSQLNEQLRTLVANNGTSDEAGQIFTDLFNQHTNGRINSPRALAQAVKLGQTVQAEFLGKFNNASQKKAVSDLLRDTSVLGSQMLEGFDSRDDESKPEFLSQAKFFLDEMRKSGVVDPTQHFVRNMVIPKVTELGQTDPEAALDLLDTIEELDVTGKGGVIGNIGNIQNLLNPIRGRLLDEVDSPESFADFSNKLRLEVAGVEELVVNRVFDAKLAGEEITPETIETLNQEFLQTFGTSTNRGKLKQVFDEALTQAQTADDKPAREFKEVEEQVVAMIASEGVVAAREFLSDTYDSGEVSAVDRVRLNKFINNSDLGLTLLIRNQDAINEAVETSILEMLPSGLPVDDNGFRQSVKDDLISQARQATIDFDGDVTQAAAGFDLGKAVNSSVRRNIKLLEPVIDDQRKAAVSSQAQTIEDPVDRSRAVVSASLSGAVDRDLLSESLQQVEQQITDKVLAIKNLKSGRSSVGGALYQQGLLKDYFQLKSLSGYHPYEIIRGSTFDGFQIPEGAIDPLHTPLFYTMEALRQAPDAMIDKLAEMVGLPADLLVKQQTILLRNR